MELYSTHKASLLGYRFDIDLSDRRSYPQKRKYACEKATKNVLRSSMNSDLLFCYGGLILFLTLEHGSYELEHRIDDVPDQDEDRDDISDKIV